MGGRGGVGDNPAGAHVHALAPVHVGQHGADDGADGPFHQDRAPLDDRDPLARGGEHGGDLAADEPAAEDDGVAGGAQRLAQPGRVGELPDVVHPVAGQGLVAPCSRPGGQDQPVEADEPAGAQRQ